MTESQMSSNSLGLTDAKIRLKGPARILVIRTDKLGDVILSTPVFEVIKRHYSKSFLAVMVKENVMPVIKGISSIDQALIFDPEFRHSGVKGFIQLYKDIKKLQFDIAIVLKSNWKIALALFLARVRFRVGPFSKMYSFLFYNRGVRQKRSHVEMHEADYNLQLLRKIGIRVGTRNVETSVYVSEEAQLKAKSWLLENGWDNNKPLIVVHPGMGGSALNWPEVHYQDLVKGLVKQGIQILLTAGPTEGVLLDRIESSLGEDKNKVIYFRGKLEQKVDFLAALILNSYLMIAPSTGPLHLAIALGKRVVTFYPPIRVQSALRWGPYLRDESKASVLVPETYCGEDFKCLENLCNYHPCMKSLTVKNALEQANKQIKLAQAWDKMGENQLNVSK